MVLAWLAGAALGSSAGVAVRAAAPLPCRTCFCSLWIAAEQHLPGLIARRELPFPP